MPDTSASWHSRFTNYAAWTLLVLALCSSTVFGLVTPYLLIALGVVTLLLSLVRGQIAAAYQSLASRLFLLAFVMLGALFVLTAQTPHDAIYTLNFSMLALFGPLALTFERSMILRPMQTASLLATSGVIASLLMVLAVMVGGMGRPRGFNLGPIVLSNAVLALAVVATMGAVAMKNRWSLLLPFTLVGAVATALLTQSRGPLIAVGPLLLFTAVFLWLTRFKRSMRFAILAIGGVALTGLGVVLLAGRRVDKLGSIVSSLMTSSAVDDRTTGIRLRLYSAGWRAFLESPWIGHGWARLMASVYPYLDEPSDAYARKLPQLHDDVLNFAVAGGVAGVSVYCLVIAAPVIAVWRSRRDQLWTARLYGTVGLAIVYLGGGVTDLMFGHEFHTALFVILNAIVIGLCREQSPRYENLGKHLPDEAP